MSNHITYRSHLDAANTALGNSDYFTAEKECTRAAICLAGMPTESANGGMAGTSMKTRAMEEIQQMLTLIRSLARRDPSNAVSPLQVTPLEYAIPGGVASDW
jgi:hypothetical protein